MILIFNYYAEYSEDTVDYDIIKKVYRIEY